MAFNHYSDMGQKIEILFHSEEGIMTTVSDVFDKRPLGEEARGRSVTSGTCLSCGALASEKHKPNCRWANSEEGDRLNVDRPLRIITTIPPEVEQYAPEIGRFVEAMVYKLGIKAHKGKWENMKPEQALALLEKEVEELRDAIKRGNMVEQLLESADVANFALIISAIAMEKK